MKNDYRWTHATLHAVRDLTDDVREFLLKPDLPISTYRNGSHLQIEVRVQGRPCIRHYSLVGSPRQDGLWRIAVRRAEDGRGGSLYMWSLTPGARLHVTEPLSRFELIPSAGSILLLAGGIGITPIHGMAEALLRKGADITLAYVGRSRRLMAYADELTVLLGDRLRLFPDDEPTRLDLAGLISTLPAAGELYVCGPIGLLEAAHRTWSESGRCADRLHFESFGSSGRHPSESFTIRVPGLVEKLTVPRDGTILAALRNAGIEALSGCERGECGLCAVTILAVDGMIDHRDVYLSDRQHAENQKICACVSRVVGGSVTLDIGYRPDG